MIACRRACTRSREQSGIHALARHVGDGDPEPTAAERQKVVVIPADAVRRDARTGALEAGVSTARRPASAASACGRPRSARGWFAAAPRSGRQSARPFARGGRDSPASAGSRPRAARTRRRRTDRTLCRTRCADAGPAAAPPLRAPRARASGCRGTPGRAPARRCARRLRGRLPPRQQSRPRPGGRQQPAQPVAGGRLVVHDQRANHRTCSTAGVRPRFLANERQRHRHGRLPAATSRSTVSVAFDWK